MLKNRIELVPEQINTVEDLIKVLMKVPAKYKLNANEQPIQVCVDHDYECVYMGAFMEIVDYVDDVEKELAKTGQASKISVPDEKLQTFQQELHAVVGYADANENGSYETQLYGVFSKKEIAEECGDELVECGNIHHYEIECPILDEFGWK